MAGLTLANADKVLKEFYLAPVREQLNNASKFLAQLEKNERAIQGKRAYVPIHVSRNAGIGARADGATLPTAGNQGYEDSLVPLKHNYGRFKVTGPTIRATKTDDGSFIRAVDSEMKGVVRDLKRDLNRQVFGTSNGVILQFGTTSSGDVLTAAATTTKTQLRQVEVGMVIDVGTVASPATVADSLVVAGVDLVAKTVTVAAGTGVVTSSIHFLFRHGNGGATTAQKEVTGLATQVAASGTLFDVDPTAYPVWASYVDSAGANRLLTEDKVQEVSDNVEIVSGETPNLWVGSYGVVRSFSNQLAAQKRFVNTLQLKAGWSGIELAASGSVFAKDRDCQENTAYALSTDSFQEYRMADYDFADYDGRVLRNTANEDGWEGFVVCDHEFATSRRNANGLVTQITE